MCLEEGCLISDNANWLAQPLHYQCPLLSFAVIQGKVFKKKRILRWYETMPLKSVLNKLVSLPDTVFIDAQYIMWITVYKYHRRWLCNLKCTIITPTMYRAYVDIFTETGQHGVDTIMVFSVGPFVADFKGPSSRFVILGYINKMDLTIKAGTQIEDRKPPVEWGEKVLLDVDLMILWTYFSQPHFVT